MCKKVEKGLDNLVLRFWPRARSKIDLQAYYQARLLVVFSLLGSLLAIGFGFLFWLTLDSALGAAGFLIIGAGVGALPLVFRRTGSSRVCGHLLALLVLTASAYVAIIRGGFPLNALLFVASIPLITSYLIGPRGALWWSAISALTCFGLWLRAQTGHADWRLVQPTAQQVAMVDLLGLVGLLFVMTVLAVTYEYARQMAETRRQEALERLAQSQRLESVGQLAGGVAHDFNNILTVIKGTADMVLSETLTGDLARDVTEIRIAAERASDLTNQLLLFSQRKATEAVPLDLAACLEQLLPLLKRTLCENIQLELDVAQGLGAVLLDRTQFEQVVLNLVSNAMDAMPAGGRLGIELAHLCVKKTSWPILCQRLPEGHYVELRVRDTGQGMSAEQQEHIFEPFFTTKAPGFGSGLGLASVHGIVEQFSGHVWVESSPGAGSCFHVVFEQIEANSVTDRTVWVNIQGQGKRDETVLLVEDDPSLRFTVAQMLRRAGYRVLEAQDGPHALKLLDDAAGRLDLLLTDVVMPKMPGTELAARVHTKVPGAQVVFMSGYTGPNGDVALEVEADHWTLLRKPFSRRELLDKLEEVLSSSSA